MLCAQLVGMEAAINFEQIYTIPVLQTLGMPLPLTYLPGLVSGPTSLFLLPLIGMLIDKGRSPYRRKFAALVFAAGLQITGMLGVLTANFLHLRYLIDLNNTTLGDNGSDGFVNSSVVPTSVGDLYVDGFGKYISGKNISVLGQDSNPDSFVRSGDIKSSAVSLDEAYQSTSSAHFKAGIGMLGFILMDLGFDASNCFVKAFLVSCSPRADHTSLIVLGVMMGAVGGVTNAALGLLDFTSFLDLTDIEGGKLTIQTSVQAVVLIVLVILGLLTTSITGYNQLRQLQNKPRTISSQENAGTSQTTKPHHKRKDAHSTCNKTSYGNGVVSSHRENFASRRPSLDAFENSIRSFSGGGIYLESSMSLVKQTPRGLTEDIPLLKSDSSSEEVHRDHLTSLPEGYGSGEQTSSVGKPTRGTDSYGDSGSENDGTRGCFSYLQNLKVRFALVCVTSFFAADSMMMYTVTVSDFMGKAVYDGDPAALPGSDSLNRYHEGIEAASWALGAYFVTYLLCSMIHPKILAILGFRVEFTLLQTLMVVSMVICAWTRRLEAVFVLSVVAGAHRTCFYTMPYAVTNDIAQTMVSTGSGRSPVGLAMSLVAASIPLAYCALFSWAGAVQQLTGDVSASLWLGSPAGVLAVIAFLFVGKV
ncbi:hypothetical protein ACOMHN_062508 [Nucella lapillus]